MKLPDCQMPAGAEPCLGFHELCAEVEQLRAELKDARRPGRFYIETPDSSALARWSRDGDIATIARCILATLKYEPHTADVSALRRALEGVIQASQAAP